MKLLDHMKTLELYLPTVKGPRLCKQGNIIAHLETLSHAQEVTTNAIVQVHKINFLKTSSMYFYILLHACFDGSATNLVFNIHIIFKYCVRPWKCSKSLKISPEKHIKFLDTCVVNIPSH